MSFYNLRPFLNWGLMIAAILGVIYIGYSQSNTSNVMRIASGERGSYLYSVGKELKLAIEQYTDYKVELVVSRSSTFNRGVLQSGKADVAIISPAASSMTNMSVVVPISKSYIHVIVKENSSINSISNLAGHRISLGALQSDHRQNALKLLDHYRVEEKTLRNTEVSPLELLEGDNLDGAIITSSFKDEYLQKLMASGNFKLIEIEAAEGAATAYPYLHASTLPVGVYPSIMGPMPTKSLSILSTDALLVTRTDAPSLLVEGLLTALLNKDVSEKFPLIKEWLNATGGILPSLDTHEAALHVFNPYSKLQKTAYAFLLQLWIYKWVILCLTVLFLSALSRWFDIKNRKAEENKKNRFQRIEKLLEDINQHEMLQADTKDYRLLTRRLAEARKIKQDGIQIACEQNMSNSPVFIAFLQQCDHVIKDIQWKLSLGLSGSTNVA
jgi:TRAP transporter TAXI family solute receptor